MYTTLRPNFSLPGDFSGVIMELFFFLLKQIEPQKRRQWATAVRERTKRVLLRTLAAIVTPCYRFAAQSIMFGEKQQRKPLGSG